MHFWDLITKTFVIVTACISQQALGASQCYGTVNHGRIEGSVQLPESGANFTAYSSLGSLLGRTYVHSTISEIVTSTYSNLKLSFPSKKYVYGETGWRSGGRIRPHRTHQNGLSVDFFVPVIDAAGSSVPLPSKVGNKFGYDIEFTEQAKYGQYNIDFPAMAEHLYQLHQMAKKHGVEIKQVIFERAYLPKLFATKRGSYLSKNLIFMKGKPWVRHDEHYHVDFAIDCKSYD